jgi:hypothetical protein
MTLRVSADPLEGSVRDFSYRPDSMLKGPFTLWTQRERAAWGVNPGDLFDNIGSETERFREEGNAEWRPRPSLNGSARRRGVESAVITALTSTLDACTKQTFVC